MHVYLISYFSLLVVSLPRSFLSYVYSPYQYFKRLHIPGPPPRAIDGNTSELLKLVRVVAVK